MYVDGAKEEACKLLASLCDAMNQDLDMVEASEVYQNRVPSDKLLPQILAEATAAVKKINTWVNTARGGGYDIYREFENFYLWIVQAHRLVKKCLVMLIGKCDQTSMEMILGYEVTKLSELGLEGRDVLTYHQMAKKEMETDAAQAARLHKAQQELERVETRERTVQEEHDKEHEAMQSAKESKNKLRIVVVREVNKLKQKIRELDQFVDDSMNIMNLDYFPHSLQRSMDHWRSQAMSYIDVEAKAHFKNAYARQIKKKDKYLLKNEQELLNIITEQMQLFEEQHGQHIAKFVVELRNKVKEQLPSVDTNDFDLHEAMMDMNTKVAFIQKYPWVAREEFGPAWWAVEATHKRMKELIFLEREQYGTTNLENYLGNILVPGDEVAQGLNPSEYVVEENLGIEAMHPLPPSPAKPVAASLIPEQPPKKLTAREKREQERLAQQLAEERKRQEAAEAAARRRKRVKRKLDPATAAILKEKAEAKAKKDAAEREARRKAKELRDAKKAAVEEARKQKHASLTQQAKMIKKIGQRAARARAGEEDEEEDDEEAAGPSKRKRKVKIVDVNALAKKIFEKKVKDLSTVSRRPGPDELRRLEYQAMREAEASITVDQRVAMEQEKIRQADEEAKKKDEKAKRALSKAEKEKELQDKIKRMKAQKAEELKAKAEAAKEALRKKRESEAAGREHKPISEEAMRRRQAAKMVSKPSESERKPRKVSKPKPKIPEKKDLEAELAQEAKRAKREAVEKNLQRLREVEAFKKEQRRKKMQASDMGYPGLSSFGKNRSRQAKPPIIGPGCAHDHSPGGGDSAFPGGPLAGKHDSMLVLLKPTQSQYKFIGTEPHMYEPEPVIEQEW